MSPIQIFRFFSLVFLCTIAISPTLNATEIKLGAQLTGDQENPPVVTDASGFAILTYDDAAKSLDVTLLADGGLTMDDITGFHLHGPAPVGTNASVIVGLDNLAPIQMAGNIIAFTATDVALPDPATNEPFLLGGLTYLNLHTTANPSGEIRGQVVPEPNGVLIIILLMGLGLNGRMRRRQ